MISYDQDVAKIVWQERKKEIFLQQKLKEKGLLQDMIIHCACCDDEWSDTVDHFKDLELIAKKVCQLYSRVENNVT